MILVLSGTKEGTEIISLLADRGNKVCALMATAYGTNKALALPGVEVMEVSLNKDSFRKACRFRKISVVIDATHPFPGSLSKIAKDFCNQAAIPYLRFLREELDIPENPLITQVFSWEEAAAQAAGFGDTIFLTTGSNNLEAFLANEHVQGKRIVVRVLPDFKVVQKCQNLGITPKDIVAMQGPFSKEMNRQQFKMYNASVIVTKDSGKAGGTDTKISAALSMGLPVVVIRRDRQKNKYEVTDYKSLLETLEQF